MWRKLGLAEAIVDLDPGVSIGIPTGTRFKFRCDGPEPLMANGVTMPPWPGADEALALNEHGRPRYERLGRSRLSLRTFRFRLSHPSRNVCDEKHPRDP